MCEEEEGGCQREEGRHNNYRQDSDLLGEGGRRGVETAAGPARERRPATGLLHRAEHHAELGLGRPAGSPVDETDGASSASKFFQTGRTQTLTISV